MLEIQVPIEGNERDIVEMLKEKGLPLVHHARVIANYYLPPNETIDDITKIKEKSLRLRKGVTNNYHEGFSIYNWQLLDSSLNNNTNSKEITIESDAKSIELEKKILKNGFKLIYTDDKTDNVFMNDEYVFQIQNINGIGLTCSTDKKLYANESEEIQRKLLLNDILKFGMKYKSTNDVNRFNLLLDKNYKPITLSDVINILKDYSVKK